MDFRNPAASARANADAYTASLLDLLGDEDPFQVQEGLLGAIEGAIAGLSDAQLRRREREGKWSILQVLEHLIDTEMVYGYRMRKILAEDQPAIEGYDQDLWVQKLRSNEADPSTALIELRILRDRNLRLLRALAPEEWERDGLHSERGPESVRRIHRLLAGHDLVHRAQIERIRKAIEI